MTSNGKPRMSPNQFTGGEWQDRSEVEPFAQCPQIFNENLTPDEFRARQQIYQQAWERAVRQIRERGNHQFGFGEGI